MDERARETFKIRFIKLTLLLNAIVLLVAIGALILIRYHSLPGIAVGLVLFASAVITYIYFSRYYQETRDWLEVNAGTGGTEKH
ncbi:MAG TPA: hypothetical protein VMB35_06770 [Methanomicrobiales archaeon]|nr:hypothetical protein [Methanomicrobiales archaeon]